MKVYKNPARKSSSRSIKSLPSRKLDRAQVAANKERVDKFYGKDAMTIFSMI